MGTALLKQKYLFCLYQILFLLIGQSLYAKFSAGIGYIDVPEYRKDNLVSPLPFGWNTVPLISYRGEKLSVFGPNLSYHFLKGPIALDLSLKATGDRYQSKDLKLRDTSIDGGFRIRLYFINLSYHGDIARTYNGQNASFGLSWRFQMGEKLFFIPSAQKEFYTKEFINFYYGIKDSESAYYSSYEVKGIGSKSTLQARFIYSLNKTENIVLSLSQNYLGDSFTNSPTNEKTHFLVWSLFWSREI